MQFHLSTCHLPCLATRLTMQEAKHERFKIGGRLAPANALQHDDMRHIRDSIPAAAESTAPFELLRCGMLPPHPSIRCTTCCKIPESCRLPGLEQLREGVRRSTLGEGMDMARVLQRSLSGKASSCLASRTLPGVSGDRGPYLGTLIMRISLGSDCFFHLRWAAVGSPAPSGTSVVRFLSFRYPVLEEWKICRVSADATCSIA